MADAIGVALLFTAAFWVKVAGLWSGEPFPMATLLLVMSGVYAAARVVTVFNDAVIPLAGLGAGVLAVVVAPTNVLDSLTGPIGYANATAAFFVLAVASSVVFALRARAPAEQVVGTIGAVAFAAVPLLNGSLTGTVTVALLPLGLFGLANQQRARRVIIVAALVWALVLVTTVGLASARPSDDSITQRAVESSLTTRRTALWNDALTMLQAEPLLGIGPRQFAEESALARDDQDARWAHHEYLQFGAETGAIGFLLALAIPAWAFWRLWLAGRAGAAVAAVGLAGVAIHAAVDYVLHFWPVALLAVALVAAGAGRMAPGDSTGP